jgi:hypothetical protein
LYIMQSFPSVTVGSSIIYLLKNGFSMLPMSDCVPIKLT